MKSIDTFVNWNILIFISGMLIAKFQPLHLREESSYHFFYLCAHWTEHYCSVLIVLLHCRATAAQHWGKEQKLYRHRALIHRRCAAEQLDLCVRVAPLCSPYTWAMHVLLAAACYNNNNSSTAAAILSSHHRFLISSSLFTAAAASPSFLFWIGRPVPDAQLPAL